MGAWVFCFILILGISPLLAGEDDERLDSKALYLFPHEVIRKEEIQILDSDIRLQIDPDSGIAKPYEPTQENVQGDLEETTPEPTQEPTIETTMEPDIPLEEGPKSLDTKIQETEGLLRRYYSQFLSEKRIWEDKNRGSKYSPKMEQNEVRLLMLELQSRLTESKLVRDSEIIYYLHKRLGDLYLERESYPEALRHFVAAYRYRNLSHTEDYFLKEDTWKEVLNEDFLQKRQSHKSIKAAYEAQIEKYEETKRKIHRLGSDYARGLITLNEFTDSKKNLEVDLENEKRILELRKSEYEESLQLNYEPYRKSKSREDAENLFKMANLVRMVEDKNKERLKVINKTSFAGRGIFVLFDYKRNTGFPAYEYLLEQSYKLDPTYAPAIQEIAKQLKLDGQKLKAIDFYKKYVELVEGTQEPNELADAYLNLAILNSDIKRKVIAAEYYEKYLAVSPEPEKIYYELGRFFEVEIGDLEKSYGYYSKWLELELENKKQKAFAYYGVSLYFKKLKKFEKEEESLLQAYEQIKNIQEELDSVNKSIVDLEREINRFKRELLLTTNDDSLAQYRILQLRMEDLKLEKDKIVTEYQSIPKSRIVRRLAELAETKKEYPKAIEYYTELVNLGNEVEAQIGLKKITELSRLNLKLKVF